MKKRILVLILAMLFVTSLACMLVACDWGNGGTYIPSGDIHDMPSGGIHDIPSGESSGDVEEPEDIIIEIDDYTYRLSGENAYISRYSGTDKEVTFPESIEYDGKTYPLIGLDESAFEGCTSLESVIIPDTITYAGFAVFNYCNPKLTIYIEHETLPQNWDSGFCWYASESSWHYVVWSFKEKAQNEEYEYAIRNDDTIALTKYKGNDERVIIPKSIENKVVNNFGNIFKNAYGITEIYIPDSIKNIKSYAFGEIDNLVIYAELYEEAKPDTWEYDWDCMGESSLNYHKVYWNVKGFGENEEYEYTIFNDNTIRLNKYYGDGGFITIPREIDGNIVKNIGMVFANNNDITDILIPDTVEFLEYQAFDFRAEFNMFIEFESVPESWGSYWQNNNVYVSKYVVWNVKEIVYGTEYDYIIKNDDTLMILAYKGNETEVTIPDNIDGYKTTTISTLFSENKPQLTKLTLSQGITDIESDAFKHLGNIQELTLPMSVKTIGANAFYDANVKKIFYMGDMTDWMSIDFANPLATPICDNGELYIQGQLVQGELVIPDEVTAIKDYTFSYFNITSVNIPQNITEIGIEAFSSCDNLTSVNMADSVTSIGEKAFEYCPNLTELTLSSGITHIKNNTFFNCGLKNITIPEGVQSIGNFAFTSCGDLQNIELPDTLLEICAYAFYHCDSIDQINIPSSVQRIEEGVFSNCTALMEVYIPEQIEYIAQKAFFGCSSAIIYCGATSQPALWSNDWNVLDDSGQKISEVVWGANTTNTDGNFEYSDNGEQVYLTKYIGTDVDVVIPDEINGLPVIGFGRIFGDNASLNSVTIGKNITNICSYAFA